MTPLDDQTGGSRPRVNPELHMQMSKALDEAKRLRRHILMLLAAVQGDALGKAR